MSGRRRSFLLTKPLRERLIDATSSASKAERALAAYMIAENG